MDRRDFLQTGAALAVAARVPMRLPQAEASVRDLCMRALSTAKAAGASYADVRVARTRIQSVATREQQITNLSDGESYGFGIRVLAQGAWGFAASRDWTSGEIDRVAMLAVAQAKANRRALQRPVTLAPTPAVKDGRWRSPIETDPFDISVEEKVALLLRANAEAQKGGARFVNSSLAFVRDQKTYASTDDVFTVQDVYRCFPQLTATAVDSTRGLFEARNSAEVAPMGLSWEWVLNSDLPGNAGRWAQEAVKKRTAKSVEPGRYDLVLEPHHLWLTIHESIAHPTELDRALGFEANYAGTSFVAPPEKFLGKFRYGPDFMNIQGDRSQEGGCGTTGYDDEGVKPENFLIIKNGMVNDYQTTREQASWLKWWYDSQGLPTRSHGCSNADSWSSVQFQRMPNVSLLPGAKELS